ncbi:DUF3310 domain-containing protein [Pseudomonas sp. LFM046]|uniref:DUF3310 domain-containing protein n=1 Tax=Pseudomonas sp. LFM046 TaxID=1608357 RepID=UPI0005CFA268|nr:DUF3310 domain-containing protein [Pseudomonas sp. LFM046]
MNGYTLTAGSLQVLSSLVVSGGAGLLQLERPANELKSSIVIEPAGERLEVAISLGGTSNSIALQAGDSANAQHLAEYIESIANGTAETASDAPRGFGPALCPCHVCAGEAISYTYMAPDSTTVWLFGVQCRHNHCQRLQDFPNEAAACAAWNRQQTEASQPSDLGEKALDLVNHPPHYTGHPSGIECIQVAEHLPFCLGNAFKYLFRRNAKNAASENIEKAIWYVNRHAERWIDWPGKLPDDVRWDLGLIATHEPHPVGAAMLIIAGEPQCGGYEACVELLQRELERVRRVEASAARG